MKRIIAEKQNREKSRELLAKEIQANKANTSASQYATAATGNRVVAASDEQHLRELKVRVASAAFNKLRATGVPIHNTRAAQYRIQDSSDYLGGTRILKASFEVKFDVPYTSATGRGIRTASIPATYDNGSIVLGGEVEYSGTRYAADKGGLAAIASIQEAPTKGEGFSILAALVGKEHQVLGATSEPAAAVAALKTAGYTVCFRNPQDALGIETKEPFYEVLASTDLAGVKKVASAWLQPNKRTAQFDPMKAPASTVPVASSPELEEFRKNAHLLEEKKAELDAQVKAYAEGLAKKEGFESSGAMTVELAALQKRVAEAADALGAPLIRLADGKLLARITSVRVNDPAWKSYLTALSSRSKKLVAYVTRWVELFRTLTVSHKWQEIEDPDIAKVFKKQLTQQSKIDEFGQNQADLAANAPQYLQEAATGKTTIKAQLEESGSEPLKPLDFLAEDLLDRGDLEASYAAAIESNLAAVEDQVAVDEQYPLPNLQQIAASAKNLSMEAKLTAKQKQAIAGTAFSTAGRSGHGGFYRACKKQQRLASSYQAQGFSEAEIAEELNRQGK